MNLTPDHPRCRNHRLFFVAGIASIGWLALPLALLAHPTWHKVAPNKAATSQPTTRKAAPAKTAPAKAAPAKAAPTKAAPVKAAPRKAAPTKAAPKKAATTQKAGTIAARKTPPKTLDAGAQLRKRVVEVKLPNGMLFLLVRRVGAPIFTAYIRVKVGGVDEQNGHTGLAHIFEHMAFKGTTVIGSKNWTKEKAVLARLTRVGDTLSTAMVRSKGKTTPEIKALKGLLKKLQKAHKKLVNTNEFTRTYSANGGTGLNATTGKDLTSYFLSLPANRLELWARQEASRLAAPVFREFYRERAVVAEERRMAMSSGGSRLYEKFIASAFMAHPYRFPTVGWMSDITTIPLSAVRQFFRKYYSPSNMVGSIVGDIDIAKTKALLLRTFGKIPKGPPPPPVRTVEPKQDGERRVKVHFHTSPQVMIGYHKPTAPHFHDDVFDVIQALLTSGPSSRLYRALVKKKFAQSVWASSLPGARFPNVFTFSVTPIAPHTTKAIEAIVYKELERLKTELVSAKELKKIHNEISMGFLRGLRSNGGLAGKLSYFHSAIGDWKYATHHQERFKRITPKVIREVARKYFVTSNRTVATLVQRKVKSKAPKATKKMTPAARRKALMARLKVLVGQLRTMRGKKRSPEARKRYVALMKQARGLIGKLRAMGPAKLGDDAPKKQKELSTTQIKAHLARRKALREKLKQMLSAAPDSPVTIRPLPAGLTQHPKTLTYTALTFTPPKPTIVKLKNGLTLYLLEDKELPLIDVFALIKTGRIYDPVGKIGVGEMTGRVMRTGGFGKIKGDALDELLAFKAAQLSSKINAEHGFASLSIHQKDLKWGLNLLSNMLRNPRFPAKKINLLRSRMMEQHRRHNDRPFRLAIHQFRKLIYGAKHRRAQKPSPMSIISIKRKDLVAFHKRYYHPNHIRMAIVGAFSTKALLKQIKQVFGGWKSAKVTFPKQAPMPKATKPVIAMINKALPQSVMIVGHLGPRRHEPMLLAGKVMNHILGGGGFSSRLMTEIRTRRGLAYFAGSQLAEGTDRGIFASYTGTRPKKTGKALQTLLTELKRMATEGKVTPAELKLTKDTFLNQFVFKFQSRAQIVYRQAYFDYFGFPKNYLETYRPKLVALTPQDIQKAAKHYIDPKQFVILVVGDASKFDIPLSKFGKVRPIEVE